MHGKTFHCLHMRPNLANPWHREFSVDMPLELFSFSQDHIQCRSFGEQCRETTTHGIL